MRVTLQKDEVWYGPLSEYGIWMPIDMSADFTARCKPNRSGNQVQPLLLSNQGRSVSYTHLRSRGKGRPKKRNAGGRRRKGKRLP